MGDSMTSAYVLYHWPCGQVREHPTTTYGARSAGSLLHFRRPPVHRCVCANALLLSTNAASRPIGRRLVGMCVQNM